MRSYSDIKEEIPSSPEESNSIEECLCSSTASDSESETSIKNHGIHGVADRSKRLKASARERRRRHVLNDALEGLRRKVPTVNQRPNKLSKIEVLRLAIDYIAMLSCYLNCTTPVFHDERQYQPVVYDQTDNTFFERLNQRHLEQEMKQEVRTLFSFLFFYL